MNSICYVATIPAVVHAFLRVHVQAASEKYRVTVICNSSDKHLLDGLNARVILLQIERKPCFWRDLFILFELIKIFRREKFNIVHSIMPKTGLLAMLAAFLTFVPVRIHTFTGQIWVTKSGMTRILLKWLDKFVVGLTTCVLSDSPSQRDFLISEGILQSRYVRVVGAGSICGIDPDRFRMNPFIKNATRNNINIDQDSKVIIFVGRLNRDKGLLDLANAFNKLSEKYKDLYLLLVGTEEDLSFSLMQEICFNARDRLRYVEFTTTPEYYMVAADIFCLPSYREGFGMTIIEAAACSIPAVASEIYGITDAVDDHVTGLLFPAGDVDALALALQKLLVNDELCKQMGRAARARAVNLFSSDRIANEMVMLYDSLVKVH